MPCGPASAGSTSPRQDEQSADPFSYSQASAFIQGWSNMTIMWAAPFRAAMVVAGEAMRGDIRDD